MQGGWEEGRMPAGHGHCLQTESDSFLPVPGKGTAPQLAQEVRLLQGGSPKCLSRPPSKDHEHPWATREQPGMQSSGSSVGRFCNPPVVVGPQHLRPQGGHCQHLPLTLNLQRWGWGRFEKESTDATRTQILLLAPHLHWPL